MSTMHRWWYAGGIISCFALVLDRLAKVWFLENVTSSLTVWPGVLTLQYHLNEHMALSLPLFPWVYYPLIAIVFGALLYALYSSIIHQRAAEYLSIMVVLVGAVSNLVDRLLYGGVIDFISLSLGNVFNIADIYIVGGIIMWSFFLFRHDRKIAAV